MTVPNKFLLAAPVFVGPIIYLAYLHLSLARKVQCQTKHYIQDKTITIPTTVEDDPEKYIIHHERARKSIPSTSLESFSKPEIPTRFLRHTMATFSGYPPAWGIWYLIKDTKDRDTFSLPYIQALEFVPGDRVCGVYVVSSRDEERIALTLDAPESYKGPVVEGMLVIELKDEENETTFINHTIMWREKGKGSAGVLESPGGRWMHGLIARGLVESGVQKLLADVKNKKER